MSNPNHLPAVPPGLAAARLRHADDFLAGRGLSRDGLDRLLRGRLGPGGRLLLTSSPVHGLANATSDLDFIRVQDEDLAGTRMATQIFDGDHHLEAISFSAQETTAALADLADLAASPPPAVVLGHDGWDRSHELRRKYLERLVNGVSLDGSSPYLSNLPALARVWKWASLHHATRHVFFLRLSEAAGESRGRLGYAVNALLHLLDAVLSHYGDVFSNRKWYLLRWHRFVRSGGAPADLAKLVDRAREDVSAVLAGRSAQPLAPLVADLLDTVYEVAGEDQRPALRLEPVAATPPVRFLPGAAVLLGATAVFVGERPLPDGTLPVTGRSDLDDAPADLLRAARGRALRLLPAALSR